MSWYDMTKSVKKTMIVFPPGVKSLFSRNVKVPTVIVMS